MYRSTSAALVKSTAAGLAISRARSLSASAAWARPPCPRRRLIDWCTERNRSAASRAALPASVADLSAVRDLL
eukprot:351091-Pyramimonas_sp.AAC.1